MHRRDDSTLWLPGFDWTAAAPAPEPPDIEERRLALRPGTSFIVQAPAGSGKTELLIQRFLVLLARVEQPEAIVAITFTVKAAGEMRTRVLDALRKASHNIEPSSAHERFTLELAREVLERNARLGWDLLNNSGRLRIQTIDALSMAITRQMPWLARFGSMPGVTEDAREMYREAARRAVQTLGDDDGSGAEVACLLRHLDNDVARAVDLLARMLETRDHWLRVMGTGADPSEVRRSLETSLQRIVSTHLVRLYDNAPAYCAGELLELLRYAAANVSGSDSTIGPCSDLSAIPEARPECIGHWLGLRKLLLTNDGEWRKRVDRSIGFPPHNKRMKQRFETLLGALAPAEEFRTLLAQVPELPASEYEEAQWEVLSALFRLLPVTVASLRVVFAEAGRVDFIEIAEASKRALGTAEQPTDLALSMGARIDHLLVDEFQDTSVTHFELLRALTADWEDGRGRTLFLVGDPMQSIYRFRQAEVALFLNVRESGMGALQPHPLNLRVNFRSARTVVEWVNTVFGNVFPGAADAYAGAVPYTPSVAFTEGEEGAAVTMHPFVGRNDQAEANLVIDLVQRRRREAPASRTAILVRARAHLSAIAASLREHAIPYRAIEIQTLADRPVIQDLLALTRALLHLADRVAWLSILRAPWCGLTLDDLYRIAGADRDQPVWSLLHDPALTLSSDGEARVARILPALTRALALRGRVPVTELVERTWIAIGGDRIVDDNDLADARAFFDLIEDSGKQGDIDDFELLSQRVQELFANPDPAAGDAVELMTIHKAKGLEFDTVILPGLGKRPKVDDSPLLLWSERPREDTTDLLMAPISARRNGNDRTYDFIRRENDAKTRNESQRLLYVACTRARTRLDLIGHVETRPDGTLADPPRDSLLAHIWNAVQPHFDGVVAEHSVVKERVPRLLRRVAMIPTRDANRVVADLSTGHHAEPGGTPMQTEARGVGTITHRLLERIAHDGIDAWTAERIANLRPALGIALGAEGIAPEQIEAACARVEFALTRTIQDSAGRWILGAHSEAESEFAVSGVIDGEVRHLVIDRTFVSEDGVRWVVDFKTSEPAGDGIEDFLEAEQREYQAQLKRYASVLAKLDGRKLRAGLYFPSLGRFIEWNIIGT
jgi:ATP-dependent helicase/nuclease subunit A